MHRHPNSRRIYFLFAVLVWNVSLGVFGNDAIDLPYAQAISHKYSLPAELRGKAREVCVDLDGIVYVRTAVGVARLVGEQIRLDQSYRPLAGKVANDLTIAGGKLYYL